MEQQSPQRVMRSYTRGLRIPLLVGRFADGVHVPGGPYTFTQFVIGATTMLFAYLTTGLWGRLLPEGSVISQGVFANILVIPLGLGAAKLAGSLPEDTNPVRAGHDLLTGAMPRQWGLQADRPVESLPKPTKCTARVVIRAGELPVAARAQGARPAVEPAAAVPGSHTRFRDESTSPSSAGSSATPPATHQVAGARLSSPPPPAASLIQALGAAIREG